jgi:hypothetical protein
MSMDAIWIAPHAVTRFCQRILEIGNVYVDGNARIVAEAHCAAAGLEYEAVRKMIATPKVKAELSMGKAQCRERLFTAIFDGGNIITILPAKAKNRVARTVKSMRARKVSANGRGKTGEIKRNNL